MAYGKWQMADPIRGLQFAICSSRCVSRHYSINPAVDQLRGVAVAVTIGTGSWELSTEN
jgi:hypothetical protein